MTLPPGTVRRGRIAALSILCTTVAACVTSKTPPSLERPLTATDVALTGPAIAVPTEGWWLAMEDTQLDGLVATALARNPGLAGALARVRFAREQAAIVDSADAPVVNFDATEFRTRVSENYVFPPPYGGGTYWDGRIGFNLGWHLDFWGRQAALIEQASRGADASALDAAASELMLSSAVAQAYVDYARALKLEEVALRAQAQRRALADLTTQRADAGLDSKVEVQIAEANLEQSAVDIEQARLGRDMSLHVLAALTGASAASPPALHEPAMDFERVLPIPATLPTDLLARRPDVRAAQARIAAASAGVDAARSNFYPNVDIVAFAGTTAIGLDKILDGDSLQWSVGPAIHLPIFNAGRLKAEYRRSGAELDAAIASYNETVLRAVREAADQATRLRSFETQLASQQRSLAAAELAYDLAKQRYQAGLASQVTVLTAETQVLVARRQRTQMLADRAAARVALLVALGGHLFQEPVR